MGTMTGLAPDDTIGVAPGALWIASNAIDQGAGPDFDNDVIACLEFMADPDGDPADHRRRARRGAELLGRERELRPATPTATAAGGMPSTTARPPAWC